MFPIQLLKNKTFIDYNFLKILVYSRSSWNVDIWKPLCETHSSESHFYTYYALIGSFISALFIRVGINSSAFNSGTVVSHVSNSVMCFRSITTNQNEGLPSIVRLWWNHKCICSYRNCIKTNFLFILLLTAVHK